MFVAIKERRFAKRIIRRLLKSYAAVSDGNSAAPGEALYRDVLLHSELADTSNVDKIISQARDSVDLWTTSSLQGFGFRQIVHFVVMSQYRAAGHVGTVISFRDIIYAQVPADF